MLHKIDVQILKNYNQENTNTEIRSKGSADGLVRCLRGEPDGLPGLTSVSWAYAAPFAEDENYNNRNHNYTNTNRLRRGVRSDAQLSSTDTRFQKCSQSGKNGSKHPMLSISMAYNMISCKKVERNTQKLKIADFTM